jgi:hypothetical protein
VVHTLHQAVFEGVRQEPVTKCPEYEAEADTILEPQLKWDGGEVDPLNEDLEGSGLVVEESDLDLDVLLDGIVTGCAEELRVVTEQGFGHIPSRAVGFRAGHHFHRGPSETDVS